MEAVPITLPKFKGVKPSITEERERRLVEAEAKKQASAKQSKKAARRH